MFVSPLTKYDEPLWNELPSINVKAVELQRFKFGADTILSGVDKL